MTVQEWLGENNQLGIDIWERKYRRNKETFEQWLDRVSGGNEQIKELIKQKKFLFGGRILSNRGAYKDGEKVTYSNCFPKETPVYTKNGFKFIDEIEEGEEVLTHNNRFCRVNHVLNREYNSEISIIDLYNSQRIVCTSNHQFLTNNGWVKACDLTNNDYVKYMNYKYKPTEILYDINDLINEIEIEKEHVVEYTKTKLRIGTECIGGNSAKVTNYGNWTNRFVTIDSDLLYVIGRWLGDGSITKRKSKDLYSIFQIVFSDKEIDDLERCKKILDNHFGISLNVSENKEQHILILRTDNIILSEFFNMYFGNKCETKKFGIKDCLHDINWVIGLLDADGLVTDNGIIRLSIKNLELLKQVKECLSLNNINSADIKKVTNNKKFYIYKLEIPKYSSIKLLPKMDKKYEDDRMSTTESFDKKYIDYNNELYIRVKNITEINLSQMGASIQVYNLSVEEDNSYVVNGVVAHNCYVITPPEDNIESIFDCAKKLARTFSYGGGCGIDIGKLSPRGAKVNNTAKATSGSVSFMDLYSLVTGLIGQNGRRKKLNTIYRNA